MSEKKNTNLEAQIRYRTVQNRVDRLRTVMKEFRIKYVSRLLDILIDSNIDAELDYDDELKFEVFKKICDERFLPYIHTNAMAVILLEVFEHTSDSLADFEKALGAIADSADARYSDRFKNYKILKIELDIQDNQDDELEILDLLDDFFDEIEYYYSLEMNESGKSLLTVTSYGNIDFEKFENELKAYY